MLEDELVQSAGFKDDGIFVEGTHSAGELYTIEQMHGDMLFPIQRSVEKRLLDIVDRHGQKHRSPFPSPAAPLPTTVEARMLDKNSGLQGMCPIYN